MSTTTLPTRNGRPPEPSSGPQTKDEAIKPARVLACLLCQQRKVKCDRKFPCGNCVKSRVQCTPAAQFPRRRKRRFAERELLDRLRKYEELLRQNNIKFDPLHADPSTEKDSPNTEGGSISDDEQGGHRPSDSPFNMKHRVGLRSLLHSSRHQSSITYDESDSSEDPEELTIVDKAWTQLHDTNDNLLFGFRKTSANVTSLHPEPAQIFRLWQVYLENVDPLFKVIHTPTLQGSIVEAASNIANVKPVLEALMFGIYCVAVYSLENAECLSMFGAAKDDLLTTYWYGCQQALVSCGFLRTNDRDCLTAFFLYLVSLRHSTMPQSLSTMLGVGVRIAHRMGLHMEQCLVKCTALEAEMRRRLWWAITIFDIRIGELADSKAPVVTTWWDCKIPLNVNDSELKPKMKDLPPFEGRSSEAFFIVVRSVLWDLIRQHAPHLVDVPSTKASAKEAVPKFDPAKSELDRIESMLEDVYFRNCDMDDRLHFMTVWMTRAALAKGHVLEHFARSHISSLQVKDSERDLVMPYAIKMLECDTKLLSSPLIKGFHWLVQCYFPMFAYIQVVQILKRHPLIDMAGKAWEAMSENYESHFGSLSAHEMPFVLPFFKAFSEILFQGWSACQTAMKTRGEPFAVPRIVMALREKALTISTSSNPSKPLSDGVCHFTVVVGGESGPSPMGFGEQGLGSVATGAAAQFGASMADPMASMPGLDQLDMDFSQFDWTSMDWAMGGAFDDPDGSTNAFLQY